jgi:hypothetical protein
MARSLFGRVHRRWRRRSGRVADIDVAERAYRQTAALAQRDAARSAFRRRWGGYVCHMPNDPYEDVQRLSQR